jgi:hypothetical protein
LRKTHWIAPATAHFGPEPGCCRRKTAGGAEFGSPWFHFGRSKWNHERNHGGPPEAESLAICRAFQYVNVMATVAVFIALGVTSYAVATGSIDSREIKNNLPSS